MIITTSRTASVPFYPDIQRVETFKLLSNDPRSLRLHVKYLKNGDRYDVVVNISRIGNRPWVVNWHHHLWPWM